MVGTREVFWDLYQYLFFLTGKKSASSLEGTYFWTLYRNSLTLSILNTLTPIFKHVLLSYSC
jgi:hypothetical protein